MGLDYEIGPFHLDTHARVMTHAGVPVPLGPRAVAVLGVLVERSNEFVDKALILEAAWPGVIVEEGNLAVQISAIRRVLSQVPGGERWVETLARRGYRFVGPVRPVAGDRAVGSLRQSNLPEPMTSFVGRERERREIERLLTGTRLLTLTGIGGIGKTRLSHQIAVDAIDAYPDGVWFADLAPLSDPAWVPSAVAQVLGVSEPAGKPLLEALCNQVRGRRLMLVLDNCEHLLDACAQLAEALLRNAAEATILATSREPLQVAGEQTYPVPPLSLPDPKAGVEAVRASEAVRLFVDRARQQQPHFELGSDRARSVAELCLHLDGIPLALELAAARVPSLSIDQINARLDDRFKLLTGGTRTALPRHQTLRGTLDWSHGLLSDEERVVLRRVAIFPGGFALEAAASVASDETIGASYVENALAHLVLRSLIVAETNDAGARYRLLETTRAYAMEKLVAADEVDAVRRRHAKHLRDRFEHAYDDWLAMSDADWHARYLAERDNVRAALDWAFGANGDAHVGIALAAGSGPLWAELSLPYEGWRRLDAAIERIDTGTSTPAHAQLWLWRALLGRYRLPAKGVADLEIAVDLFRRQGNAAGLGHALARLGGFLTRVARFDQSGVTLREAHAVLRRAGPPKALGFYFAELALLEMCTNDLSGARRDFEKSIALCRNAGAEAASLGMLGQLADLTWAIGDLDAARAALAEAIARMRGSRFTRKHTLGTALMNFAGALTERGELDEALTAAREGLPLCLEAGYAWNHIDHLALRTGLAGNLADAARLAGFADAAHRNTTTSREPNEARARAGLQALLEERFVAEDLRRLLDEGAELTESDACRLALET